MGKVKSAVPCSLDPDGKWRPDPRYPKVAIKQIYRACIAAGTTMAGVRVKENPLVEASVLQHLSGRSTRRERSRVACDINYVSIAHAAPGHRNVLRLHATLVDERCLYLVLEFVDGAELFSIKQRALEPLAQHIFWQVGIVTLTGSAAAVPPYQYFLSPLQLLQGLKYTNSRGLAHRDVSLENGAANDSVKCWNGFSVPQQRLTAPPLPHHPSAMVTLRVPRDPHAVKLIDFGLAAPLSVPAAGARGRFRFFAFLRSGNMCSLSCFQWVKCSTWPPKYLLRQLLTMRLQRICGRSESRELL